jgi:4-amino-4-deoxy-L-arabinose transferase-like glycosyltransferase
MRLAGFLLAAVCALTLFTGLDRVGFLDWREARDAQVAREMIEGREVLTPLLGHEALFEKPAPAYAPEALVQLLGGGSPATSRRARAVLAVLLLLITGSIGAQMFGLRAGVLTAIVLGTSLILPLAARVDGTQLLASLLGWVGVAGLADVEFGRRAGRSLRLVVTWGALAAALMVGGPLPALWPIAGWALYVALARKDGAWRRAALGPGLTILIGVGLPWYGAMSERHGAAFLSHAPFFPYAVETRGAWWTGPILTVSFLVVSFFPWSALLPGAISHAATWWRRVLREAVLRGGEAQRSRDPIEREVREEGAAHFFIACLLAALAPIALYPGPPLTAALPAIPAAALLCGRLLDHLFEDPRRLHVPVRNAVWMLVLVGTVGAVLVAMVAPRIGDAAPDLRLLATMVFVAAWIPFLANLLGRRRVAVMAMALPVAIGAPIVQWRVLPAMEEWLNTRAVCDAMSRAAPEFASLVTAEPPRPSLRLYTTHNLVEAGALRETVAEQRARDGLTYLVFRPVRESWVASHAGGVLEIVLRTPTLVLARVHPVPG